MKRITKIATIVLLTATTGADAQTPAPASLPSEFSINYLDENQGDYTYLVLLEKTGKDKWDLMEITTRASLPPRIRNEEQEVLMISDDYRMVMIRGDRPVTVLFSEDKITEKRSNFLFDCDTQSQSQILKKKSYSACNSYFTDGYSYSAQTLGGPRSFEKRTIRAGSVRQALISANVVAGIEQFKMGAWVRPTPTQAPVNASTQPFQLWVVKPTGASRSDAYIFRADSLYARGDQLRLGSDQLHLVTSSFGVFGSRDSKQPWDQVYRFIVLDRNKSESRALNTNAPHMYCEQINLAKKDGSSGKERICSAKPEAKYFLFFSRNQGPLVKVDAAKGAKKPIGSGDWQPAELKLDTYSVDEIRVIEDELKADRL